MAKYEGGELLKCSFCGKSQKQVRKLIAGPGVYICDECVELCNEIIEEELADTEEVSFAELPKPNEIYEFLDGYVVGQEKADDWPFRSTVACCSALTRAISVICLMSAESVPSAPRNRAMEALRRRSKGPIHMLHRPPPTTDISRRSHAQRRLRRAEAGIH